MLIDAVLLGARLGSAVTELAVAEFINLVPSGVRQITVTASLNCAEAPLAIDGVVHLTWPVLPDDGVLQDHPAGAVSD